ncbi:MAG TPA: hypothetical protein VKF62_13655 [Planctomycetota bacterium]|nr:hypothetical protein [Planctomycetota bacterium]
MRSVAFEGLVVPLDRERRAEVLEAKATDRLKEFSGKEDQGLSISVRMPEQSVNRVDLLIHEEEFPGTLTIYLDPDKQGDAFAWRASFEIREDGAVIFHPALNGGEYEEYLARRLHDCGLLVLRKEGRVVLGAPLFCDGKRDDREKLRTFLREALTFVLVKAEIERRLVYPPGMEPPPLELPAGSGSSKSKSRAKKKPKPVVPAAAGKGPTPATPGKPGAAGKGPTPATPGKPGAAGRGPTPATPGKPAASVAKPPVAPAKPGAAVLRAVPPKAVPARPEGKPAPGAERPSPPKREPPKAGSVHAKPAKGSKPAPRRPEPKTAKPRKKASGRSKSAPRKARRR